MSYFLCTIISHLEQKLCNVHTFYHMFFLIYTQMWSLPTGIIVKFDTLHWNLIQPFQTTFGWSWRLTNENDFWQNLASVFGTGSNIKAREDTEVHLYETLDKVLLVKRIVLNTI